MKIKIIIVLSIFLLLSVWQINIFRQKYFKEKENRERIWQNFVEVSEKNKEYTHIIATQEEWKKKISHQYDSVLKALKVKPKEVIRYEERTIKQVEKDTVYIEVEKITPKTWHIFDSGPCFQWEGIAIYQNNENGLEIKRTGFFYENKITNVLTRKVKKKFLFFNVYDKKRFELKNIPQCGEVEIKIIEIQK